MDEKKTKKKPDEKVFTIKTRVVLKPEYSNNNASILLLIPRLLASPGHQQRWYWQYEWELLHNEGLQTLCATPVLRNDRRC